MQYSDSIPQSCLRVDTPIASTTMDCFSLCELCMDNGPFFCCVSACYVCGDNANYCVTCWIKWILTCEEQQRPHANCPHCGTRLADATVQDLMGRSYQHKVPKSTVLEVSWDGDDDTLSAALDFRRCSTCSTWTDRGMVGNVMQCLCGARFCWQCDDTCDCNQEFCFGRPSTEAAKREIEDGTTECDTTNGDVRKCGPFYWAEQLGAQRRRRRDI